MPLLDSLAADSLPISLPDSQGPFDLLSAIEPSSDGHVRAILPETWHQGRGLFGGLVTAVLTRALESAAPQEGADARPLRSLTAEIFGPVQPGEADIRMEILRAGNGVTTAAARLSQRGELLAHAVGVLGRTRTSDYDGKGDEAPRRTPWRDVATIPLSPPMGPEFTQHFEFRPTGPLPFSGGKDAVVEGWVRPKNPGSKRDAGYLAGCIDAHWPALFSIVSGPRPMATVAFTFQPFTHFEGLDRDAPLYYRARLGGVDAGYSVELRELWGEDGRLLALNQQTFVVIK